MLGVALALLGVGVLLLYAAVTDQDVVGIVGDVLTNSRSAS